jgi:hypothetical protein
MSMDRVNITNKPRERILGRVDNDIAELGIEGDHRCIWGTTVAFEAVVYIPPSPRFASET